MKIGDRGFGDRSKEMLQRLEDKGLIQSETQEPKQEEVAGQPVQENTQEQPTQENNTQETTQAPELTQEDSSLNNEEQQPEQQNQGQEIEDDGFGQVIDLNDNKGGESSNEPTSESSMTDEAVLSYINEKFGQSFESIDEASSKITKEEDPLSEISSQALALDKFLKETGKNILDFVNAQAIDYEKLSDEQAILMNLRSEGYTDQEAIDLFNSRYKAENISEHLDDDEVAAIKSSNRMKEIERNALARKSRQSLLEMREKYNSPIENWKPIIQENKNEFTPEVKEAFKAKASEALDNLKTIDIPIAEGKVYRVSTEKYLSENKDIFSDPEKFIAAKFKDANGNWDAEKMIKSAMFEENFNDFASYSTKNAFQMGQKEQASHGRNLNFDASNPKRGNHASETEAEKNFKTQLAQIKEKQGRNRGMKIKANFKK